ncbi:T-cell-specific surface glycoprotein CD28-like [Polypterus senegalus]|uniref:T-cell-specific surface glycoprotein CD28-like n=1 Tax=Polypterus senegalus TaxID=55291 RepID=UPI001963097D|nr:T-cell-specific surface glycoprotein CD28-like [Polypterus senegalus]
MLPGLLLLALCLGHLKAFKVVQSQRVPITSGGMASLSCSYEIPLSEAKEVHVFLHRVLHNDTTSCDKSTGTSVDPFNCAMSSQEQNSTHSSFTLTIENLKKDDEDVYICKVEKRKPFPYEDGVGVGTLVLIAAQLPNECDKVLEMQPDPLLVTVAVIAGILLLYSVAISVSWGLVETRRRAAMKLDNNSEYMDMRKGLANGGGRRPDHWCAT